MTEDERIAELLDKLEDSLIAALAAISEFKRWHESRLALQRSMR